MEETDLDFYFWVFWVTGGVDPALYAVPLNTESIILGTKLTNNKNVNNFSTILFKDYLSFPIRFLARAHVKAQ